jgi:hypothetical protein
MVFPTDSHTSAQMEIGVEEGWGSTVRVSQTYLQPKSLEWPMTEAAIRVLRELDALGGEVIPSSKDNWPRRCYTALARTNTSP